MAIRTLPDINYIREILSYDAETGVFTWRERPVAQFKHQMEWRRWNTRYRGTAAGSLSSDGYLRAHIDREGFLLHRIAWLIIHGGPVPDVIDHIDGNGANNRANNLRKADFSGNIANSRAQTGTITGVKGVYPHKSGKFFARVVKNRVAHNFGAFATIEEAASARRELAKRLHGVFARHT